mgnify:CR=1 FL=1
MVRSKSSVFSCSTMIAGHEVASRAQGVFEEIASDPTVQSAVRQPGVLDLGSVVKKEHVKWGGAQVRKMVRACTRGTNDGVDGMWKKRKAGHEIDDRSCRNFGSMPRRANRKRRSNVDLWPKRRTRPGFELCGTTCYDSIGALVTFRAWSPRGTLCGGILETLTLEPNRKRVMSDL